MDHLTQTLTDPLDSQSTSFLATISDQAVGTVRMTLFKDIDAEHNIILQHFSDVRQEYIEQNPALLSLYCILPEYNNTEVTQALLQSALHYAVKKKVERIFVVASETLLSYYQHYRFKVCSDWYQPEGNPCQFKVLTSDIESLITLPTS